MAARDSFASTWPGFDPTGLTEILAQVQDNTRKLAALERILREGSEPPPPPAEAEDDATTSLDSLH